MDIFTAPIDFVGQERASVLYQRIINASAVLGFVVGFIIQSLYVAWGIVLVGTVLAFLVAVPSWPMYRRHPLPFKALKEPEEMRTESPAPASKRYKVIKPPRK